MQWEGYDTQEWISADQLVYGGEKESFEYRKQQFLNVLYYLMQKSLNGSQTSAGPEAQFMTACDFDVFDHCLLPKTCRSAGPRGYLKIKNADFERIVGEGVLSRVYDKFFNFCFVIPDTIRVRCGLTRPLTVYSPDSCGVLKSDKLSGFVNLKVKFLKNVRCGHFKYSLCLWLNKSLHDLDDSADEFNESVEM